MAMCLLLWQPRQTLLAPIGQVANQAVLPLTPTLERPSTPIRKLYLFDYSRDRTPKEREYLTNLPRDMKDRQDKGERDITIRYKIGSPSIVKSNSKNV
ncbi:hypothetical protein J6590_095144 [Homalodisca vitripennis]|nr:hypothetical protein J6590_095144 [Homalodisca vitripennis]